MSRRRKKLPVDPVAVQIESFSHEGRGIARIEGKTTFIDGALSGEEVLFRYQRRRARYDEGYVLEVTSPSPERVEPHCEYFAVCGGCSLQHLEPAVQIQHKQSVLLEQLQHIGGVTPQEILPALTGPVWGYRRKARLGVKYVEKKGKVLVGFREKYSPFIADIKCCEVLHPSIGLKLDVLQELVGKLSLFRQIPQIEVAVADKATALVFRHLAPFTAEDQSVLKQFEKDHVVDIYLQSAGLDSVVPLSPENTTPLSYSLPGHNVEIIFWPTDFIQVNYEINIAMVNNALELLEAGEQDQVLDLFCGLGNFSLPLARKTARVVGVEGDAVLIERAKFNALHNNINNAEFHVVDLAAEDLQASFLQYEFNKILFDPPRSGALDIIHNVDFEPVERIVYVSCNPATLARDAGVLVKEKRFQLQKTGVMDMFPHTSHVESIALFVR
ncbi:MAG: 23S rRNA (uracil(1939)-C(5))-methyltransferase RlmD [Gammaproteobacteria bacterium]